MTFLPAATSRIENYQLYMEGEHPCNHNCGTVEIIPTEVLKQFLPELAPSIGLTKMCNASLHESMLPTSQRGAAQSSHLV